MVENSLELEASEGKKKRKNWGSQRKDESGLSYEAGLLILTKGFSLTCGHEPVSSAETRAPLLRVIGCRNVLFVK